MRAGALNVPDIWEDLPFLLIAKAAQPARKK
jgi:hypothetical protein